MKTDQLDVQLDPAEVVLINLAHSLQSSQQVFDGLRRSVWAIVVLDVFFGKRFPLKRNWFYDTRVLRQTFRAEDNS
jgi:hypothetical protein